MSHFDKCMLHFDIIHFVCRGKVCHHKMWQAMKLISWFLNSLNFFLIILKLCDIVTLGLNECPIYTLTMLLVLFLRNKRDWFTLRWILRTNPEALTQTFSLWFGDRKIRLNTLLLTSLRKHHQSNINQKMSSKNNLKNVYLKTFELVYCLTLLWASFSFS